jgi:hypothetical protein
MLETTKGTHLYCIEISMIIAVVAAVAVPVAVRRV